MLFPTAAVQAAETSYVFPTPFTHSARRWGGGVSARQEGREVNVCAGASLRFGYWVVLGYLEPLDPDLCSHQGGRPLMESAAHCLWD